MLGLRLLLFASCFVLCALYFVLCASYFVIDLGEQSTKFKVQTSKLNGSTDAYTYNYLHRSVNQVEYDEFVGEVSLDLGDVTETRSSDFVSLRVISWICFWVYGYSNPRNHTKPHEVFWSTSHRDSFADRTQKIATRTDSVTATFGAFAVLTA